MIEKKALLLPLPPPPTPSIPSSAADGRPTVLQGKRGFETPPPRKKKCLMYILDINSEVKQG
jgi:hypothetical protein